MADSTNKIENPSWTSLFRLFRPYWLPIVVLVVLTIAGNGLNLVVPKIISHGIDSFLGRTFRFETFILEFLVVGLVIFILGYLQAVVQTYAAERVARDLRNQLSDKISSQDYAYVERVSSAKLLTNLTSDVDAVKMFVSQAISSIISSVFLILGASILLLLINWRLALAVLGIVPFIGIVFYLVLSRIRKLFKRSQEAIDWLNKVINESILGAALIRLLNSQQFEYEKFMDANTESYNLGMSILRLFAGLIPAITFATNLATLLILAYGGHLIIIGNLSLGDYTAFNSYLAILIFPILLIGIMSNVIARSAASYQRIEEVLHAPIPDKGGGLTAELTGKISVEDVSLRFGEKKALREVSLAIAPKSKTAIIGPTAAGKTQLLYLLTGLIKPESGKILYDGHPISDYNKESLHSQIGFVFQDSIIFNMTLRENIAFSNSATDESLALAIRTAELSDFIQRLPEKLDTVVSERGSNLSGGQKQRIMLARALALNPKILLLDEFTARVDAATEKKVLANIAANYPDLTLISVTQTIASVEHYDQIILLMEGEILSSGRHEQLLHTSPEYVQIFNSQASTNQHESR
ncbi:MAG TPA: ABC transporter ATP-binding protein [Patescibacteria group bacterium]|nr:ABC transporter ATP-binding protein [Patescibacteria group bacterium]